MSITTGTRLGPYEVISKIGSGGMGEVWRAHDTRLERSVAIKVLPSAVAHDPEFRRRFEREAKTVSQLNHPNICQIYDVGESSTEDHPSYLVMELLEGETLADRIARGALPLPDVLRYGAQVANALAVAHRAGIVHRDLKPGNIMITKAGAKLLDFGLAKVATSPLQFDAAGPTEHKPLTAKGTILGTFQYMAPEQLDAIEADARTDIFALGAVLYEMATGKRAFEGKTTTSLIAAIVERDPTPISEIQPLTPPAFEHIVMKCLEKDPDARWQSAHDVAEELKWVSGVSSQGGARVTSASKSTSRERIAWAVAGILALCAIGLATFAWRGRTQRPRLMRFSIPLPPKTDTFRFDSGALAISPDGSRVVMSMRSSSSGRQLWIRPLHAAEATPIPDTGGAAYPFWSPDSKFIAFFAGGKLRKVAADGGPIVDICDAHAGRGGSWGRDGTILLSPDLTSPIAKVSSAGGALTPVTRLDATRERTHRWPFFLPDGRHFLYLARVRTPDGERSQIVAASLDSQDSKVVLEGTSNVAYASGWLLFVRGKSLFAARFDPKKLSVDGEPIALPIGMVGSYEDKNMAFFAASQEGTLVFLPPDQPWTRLHWVDRTGTSTRPDVKEGFFIAGSVSHDGKRIAFTQSEDGRSETADIWLHDLVTSTSSRFTFDSGYAQVRWTADGTRLFYVRSHAKNQSGSLYSRAVAGGPREEAIYSSGLTKERFDVSPDGRSLIVAEQFPETGEDLMLVSVAEKKASVFFRSRGLDMHPAFSPDGRWVAYESAREVYLRRFPDTEEQWQISTGGGSDPKWSRDGKELFFSTRDGTLVATVLTLGTSVHIGAPQPLFRLDIAAMAEGLSSPLLGVSPDSKEFLVVTKVDENATTPFQIVVNWPETIKVP